MVIVLLTSGCATSYTLEGKKYDSQEKFQQAVNEARGITLQAINPLNEPVTSKKLIVLIPSEQAIKEETFKRFSATENRSPIGVQVEIIENLSKSNYKMTRVFFEAIQRRNIFRDVEIRDNLSMIGSIEPSANYDVMYYTEPSVSSGQYFYSSVKHGKQAFAFDRSSIDGVQRVKSFVDAVSALAIRD
jgi:hypothetical protein